MTSRFTVRRRATWLTVLVLGLALMSASALASATTLVHMTSGSHATEWHQWLELMAERFEEDTGIRVDVDVGPGGGAYREQLVVRTAGGVAPDVTDFSPAMGAILVKEKMFEDLRPYVAASGIDLSQYPPVAIEGTTSPDGTMWGFAVSILPIPVYFNGDMFANAGLMNPNELGENWTWDTYQASARTLTVRDAEGNPIQFGTIDPRYRWEQPIHQAGGMTYDRHVFPTESRFNTPEVLAGIEFRQKMFDDGLIATSGGVWNGNVALTMIDAPTIINKYKGGFAMDVALQPKGPGGRGGVVNPDGFQIHKDSKYKDEAWQWIHYLVTDEQGLMDFAWLTGRLPALRSAMIRYNEITREEVPSNWYALIETAFSPDAYPPYMVHDARISTVLNAEFARFWNGETAPAIVLQQVHEQVSAILQEGQ